ncbi:MAG: DsbA family protein [Gammaproteobacteria bacterium]|nr:DsbA family protein [Gammaproteobacteria bacterium]
MCSWCYAFKLVLQQLQQQLPQDIEFISLLGGLAADTDSPMPIAMQQQLQATWQRIEQKVPGIHFNYNFWQHCQPRRSTYPACRAVIAASRFDQNNTHSYETLMIEAIQNAYYQQAKNPSDDPTLVQLATQIGLDEQSFQEIFQAQQTQLELDRQLAMSQQLNAHSYPSLIIKIGTGFWPVSIDYLSPDPILETINLLLEFE